MTNSEAEEYHHFRSDADDYMGRPVMASEVVARLQELIAKHGDSQIRTASWEEYNDSLILGISFYASDAVQVKEQNEKEMAESAAKGEEWNPKWTEEPEFPHNTFMIGFYGDD